MSTRTAAYVAVGAFLLIGLVALTQVSPLLALLVGAAILICYGTYHLVNEAQADAKRVAERVARPATVAPATTSVAEPAPHGPDVHVELICTIDDETSPDVWLHRCGGRRVHRYFSGGSWVVEQVTTKDPDNPKKRVVGTPLTFTDKAEAAEAADNLARGILPEDVDRAREYGVPPVATAEARRRKIRLTGPEQARRLATQWGFPASA
jgi:hypothetical protein